ncbi:hypothetical protein C1D09_000990 [Mesorhizobium intechi]|uniref:hypothetical protein n=1 Tax=Mesorhizobium intechi TaxID=537601 RepID=UPI000CC53E1B|nr:hypothetical protein [Mesorhizobium intechi]TSE14005.1 hypothetical protein C1D09_000990 [Mesorhizobium intechi]
MPGDEIDKMVDPFDKHSMAHKWKHGTGTEAGGGDGTGEQFTGVYFASCQDCPQAGGWIGPNRPTREQAQADADAHNEGHPGHRAGVV